MLHRSIFNFYAQALNVDNSTKQERLPVAQRYSDHKFSHFSEAFSSVMVGIWIA